jgi:hypothetical protein
MRRLSFLLTWIESTEKRSEAIKRRSVGVVNGLESWELKIGWRKKSADICVVICANQRETHQHYKPVQSSGVISRRFPQICSADFRR